MSAEPQSFIAHGMHPSLEEPVADGRITVDRWMLRFDYEGGRVEIPLNDLQIQFNESGDPRIFFTDPKQPDWSIYTMDRRILDHHVFAQRNELRQQVKAVRERGTLFRATIATAVFLAAFGLLALLTTWVMGYMVRSLVARIPPQWESNLGDTMLEEFKLEVNLIDDAERVAELKALAAPLIKVMPTNGVGFKFYIADYPEPNAFALPGGHVIVSTGLLELADRPEQVAGVLAHEFAHVTHKHVFRHIISASGPFVVFQIFFGGGGALGTITAGSEFLINQNFSQSYEREADDVGWHYLVEANIDPRGLTEFFEKMRGMEEAMNYSHAKALSSHPATPERIERLEKKWKNLDHTGPFIDLAAEVRKAKASQKIANKP